MQMQISGIIAGLCLAACAAEPVTAAPLNVAGDCRMYVVPLKLPAPSYPALEAQAGYEDVCDLRFDIDGKGRPINLDTRCTYAVFRDSAEAALSTARFDPAMSKRLPAGQQCAAYVIAYEIES